MAALNGNIGVAAVSWRTVLILSMVLAVLGFLDGAGPQFTDLGLGDREVKAFIASFSLLLGIGNAINSVFIAWGMTKSSIIATAAALPEVKGIVTTSAIANTGPLSENGKVVDSAAGLPR